MILELTGTESYEVENLSRRERRKEKKGGRKKRRKENKGFNALIPFKPILKAILKRKGKSTAGGIKEVATRFYSEVMGLKVQNYEVENLVLSAAAVGTIVTAILNFFKHLRDKKAAGTITSQEEDILNLAEQTAQTVKGAAEDEVEEGIGEFIRKNGLLIAAALGIAFFAFKK